MNKMRRSFGGWVSVVLLMLLCGLILIPIGFTFLYSFFSKGEISAYLAQRGSYDDTVWLEALLSPALRRCGSITRYSSKIRPICSSSATRCCTQG